MRRLGGPHSLRTRLFVGIAATLAVSTIVMLAVGAINAVGWIFGVFPSNEKSGMAQR